MLLLKHCKMLKIGFKMGVLLLLELFKKFNYQIDTNNIKHVLKALKHLEQEQKDLEQHEFNEMYKKMVEDIEKIKKEEQQQRLANSRSDLS